MHHLIILNLLGVSLLMINHNVLDTEVFEGYKNKLKDRLFGLLCEREKDGEWVKFLETIIIELSAWEAEFRSINYLALMHKIHMLRFLSYEYFRKTIFECMNLIGILKT
jgi:hypothetical protein